MGQWKALEKQIPRELREIKKYNIRHKFRGHLSKVVQIDVTKEAIRAKIPEREQIIRNNRLGEELREENG